MLIAVFGTLFLISCAMVCPPSPFFSYLKLRSPARNRIRFWRPIRRCFLRTHQRQAQQANRRRRRTVNHTQVRPWRTLASLHLIPHLPSCMLSLIIILAHSVPASAIAGPGQILLQKWLLSSRSERASTPMYSTKIIYDGLNITWHLPF